MLRDLKIENLALIDKLDISLDKGLTVLTGETGAGKSIILSGISLVIGDKAHKELIGSNKDNVSVEAVFDLNEKQLSKLEEIGYDLEEELIIERIFDKENNKTKVNSKRYTLGSLKEISTNILDIVGQHDHQYLLNSNYHLTLLDKFLDKDSNDLKRSLKEIISNIKRIENDINNIENEKKELLEKRDLYEFSINEIFTPNFQKDEEEILEQEYKELFNVGMIKEKLFEISSDLDNNNLKNIKRNLEKLSHINDEYNNLYERYENIYSEIMEIQTEILEKDRKSFSDPKRLDEVITRLDLIKKLKLKYGRNLKELIEYGESLKYKISKIEYSDKDLNEKKEEKEKLLKEYENISNNLSKIRKNVAKDLQKKVKFELVDLNMKNVEFEIDFKYSEKLNENGNDIVKFLISTNKGSDLKDLSKIASGGEISRIMLALKIVFSKVDNISTLIFDEIDTGISGETVIKISKKLKELSKNVQIICITHSPQIAAIADNQFKIYKEDINNKTISKIIKLTKEERVLEIARILSGDNITKNSIEIAKEMMK